MYYYVNSHMKGTVTFEEKFSPYIMVLWANSNISKIVRLMESPWRFLSLMHFLSAICSHYQENTHKLTESREFHLAHFHSIGYTKDSFQVSAIYREFHFTLKPSEGLLYGIEHSKFLQQSRLKSFLEETIPGILNYN